MVGNRLGKGTAFALEMLTAGAATALLSSEAKPGEPTIIFKAASAGIGYLQTS